MAPLGSGGRFAALSQKVGSPALAAWIGRKKYGAKKFAELGAHGRAESGGAFHKAKKKAFGAGY